MIFRNKHAAHRSIDAPKEESEDTKISQTGAMTSTLWGRKLTLKSPNLKWKIPTNGQTKEIQIEFYKNCYRGYMIYNDPVKKKVIFEEDFFDKPNEKEIIFTIEGEQTDFFIELEHSKIIDEAYSVFSKVVLFE